MVASGRLPEDRKESSEQAGNSIASDSPTELRCDSPTTTSWMTERFEATVKFNMMMRSLSAPPPPNPQIVKAIGRHLQSLDEIYWATDEVETLLVQDDEIKTISLNFFSAKFPNIKTATLTENQIEVLEDDVSSWDPQNPPTLERLQLDNNRLLKLPKSISIFSNLKILTLSHNLLYELDECIGTLSNLTTLFVPNNFLHRLPDSIAELKSLQRLDVSFNSIAKLPEGLGNLNNLREFLCTGNQLEAIPSSIFDLNKIEILDLNCNFLAELPANFGSHLKIERFCCEFNCLKMVPAWLFEENCPKLRQLALTSNELTEFFRLMPEDISKRWPLLQELFIAGNSISGPLPKAIGTLKQLRKLQLGKKKR